MLIQADSDGQLLTVVENPECLDGVLAVENIEVAIALTNLGIIKQTGIKVFSDAIGPIVVQFALIQRGRYFEKSREQHNFFVGVLVIDFFYVHSIPPIFH